MYQGLFRVVLVVEEKKFKIWLGTIKVRSMTFDLWGHIFKAIQTAIETLHNSCREWKSKMITFCDLWPQEVILGHFSTIYIPF